MSNTTRLLKIKCHILAVLIAAAEWDESQVNRDESGRFAKSPNSNSTSPNLPLKPFKVPYKMDVDINVEATPSFSEYKKNNTDRVFNSAETYEILANAVGSINWEGKRGKLIKELIKQEMDETIQQAAKKVFESRKAKNLLESIDTGSSDLAADFFKKVEEKDRSIPNISNKKALMEYISISAGIAMFSTLEKLVEADLGKDIKSVDDIKKELGRTADRVLEIENKFVDSQIKGMQNLAKKSADKIAIAVTKDLPNLVKEWSKQRTEDNKKQLEFFRTLLDKTKQKATVQSASMSDQSNRLINLFEKLKNLDLEVLTRALQSDKLDTFIEGALNELFV